MLFRYASSLGLLIAAISFSANSYAGDSSNQAALLQALRQCDDKMTAVVLKHGGVNLKQPELMAAALQGMFTDSTNSQVEYIGQCVETINHLMGSRVHPKWFTDTVRDTFDLLVWQVGSFAGPGWPPNDEKRQKQSDNGSMRGALVLKALDKHGYDFRKPMQPIYVGSKYGYVSPEVKEDANLLMKLSADRSFHKAATLVASKENPFVVSMMFFAWVLSESDVNTVNSQGRSALMFAARRGSSQESSAALIGFLLDQGADKSQKDRQGKTALDYALAAGDNLAAKMLMNREKP